MYLGKDYQNFYDSTWYDVLQDLGKYSTLFLHGPKYNYRTPLIPNWNFVGHPHISEIYSKFQSIKLRKEPQLETDVDKIVQNQTPDVILIDGFFPLNKKWKNLDKIRIPKAIVIHDAHYKFQEQLEYIKRNKIDLCLSVCKFVFRLATFKKWLNANRNVTVRWLPHAVNVEIFKDYGLERIWDVISSGSYNEKIYPFRVKIKNTLENIEDINFSMPEHARFDLIKNKPSSQVLIGENYAKFLSQSKIFMFGSSIYNYPVAKYFEGMASNTLVMAPIPNDASDLHFIPDENFVEVNEKNFLEKARYYLRHNDERCQIALRGMETVQKYHTAQKRAKQLMSYLESIQH